MSNLIFLAALACILALVLAWGFKHLPEERWQMLAVVPLKKQADDLWQGANLTYYGFFISTSLLLAVILLLVLLGAAGLSLPGTVLVSFVMMAFCLPASRIVAFLVERKRHTFTVGGASFVGILLAPWCTLLVEKIMNTFSDCRLPMLPVLAAMAVAYSLGEGLGRLGCISFGCCYGKAIKDCGPFVRRFFSRTAFIFRGSTKKAIYEGKMNNQPVVPIQALTYILYCLTAITGSFLFLHGHYKAALLLSICVSQVWRILSETLRADFRGFSTLSAYQKMGGLAVIYVLLIVLFIQEPQMVTPVIGYGISLLWQPGIIIGLQIFWLVAFAIFGRSTVTTSTLSFQLVRENL
jgi:prolipoprotein diacylglyceryltransferase